MNEIYTFRSVASSDLALLSNWLNTPEVSRWYENPNYIEDLEDSLVDNRIRMQLVLHQDLPIAFVQDYDIHGWNEHPLAYLPKSSRGIDTFIGISELIGKGHGTNFLSILAAQLFSAGTPAIGIDPHPQNVAARRAYKNVGFKEDGETKSQWGKVVLMSLYSPTQK